MEKEVELKKKVGNSAYVIFPKTSAKLVKYSDTQSIADVLESILSDIKSIKNSLAVSETVYAADSSGKTIDDGSGANIILLTKAPTTES